MQHTPVIADSKTIETLKLAEDISTFFEDQKLKAQDRIRQCEAFINNLHLPSKSVKEGINYYVMGIFLLNSGGNNFFIL